MESSLRSRSGMIVYDQLEKAKSTPKHYKAKFTTDTPTEETDNFKKLCAQRIRDGVQWNITNARLWYAIDRAYDLPFYQTTHTMMRGLIDGNRSEEQILNKVKDFGLSHVLTDIPCGCTTSPCNCAKKKKLDVAVFTNILVPAVMSYHTAIVAKLFTARDSYPAFQFSPVRTTLQNKLRADIITSRVQVTSDQYGYRSIKRQAIHASTLYGFALQFPQEAWHRERQLDEAGKERVVKEGIRYCIPPPSRTYYDMSHRPDTINSDSGCRFGGYWHTVRYGEVKSQPGIWNTDRITYGTTDWTMTSGWRTYTELFPCAMSFPDIANVNTGVGDLDRESQLYRYNTGKDDQAVTLSEHFAKFAPKDHGLGAYDYPVWHRVMMANDTTVLYVEPLCYSPITYYGYDADGNRNLPCGLALQILPYQDMLGNYFTQMLISIKNNLKNCVFYNQEMVSEEDIKRLRNLGDKWVMETHFLGASKREWGHMQNTAQDAFWQVKFPQHNIVEIATAVRMLLDMLDRTLGFPSQQIGQAASHEQTAEELRVIGANTGSREAYTGGFIDDGFAAWGKQQYYAHMAYSDDTIAAEIPIVDEQTKKAILDLGFTIEEPGVDGKSKAGISGPKSKLVMDGLITLHSPASKAGSDIANQLVAITQALIGNPVLFDAIGVQQAVGWFNQIAIHAGLPSDFKIQVRTDYKGAEEQKKEVEKQLADFASKAAEQMVTAGLNEFTKTLKSEVLDPLAEAIKQMQDALKASMEKDVAQDQAIAELGEAVKKIVETITQPPPPMPPPQPQIPIINDAPIPPATFGDGPIGPAGVDPITGIPLAAVGFGG